MIKVLDTKYLIAAALLSTAVVAAPVPAKADSETLGTLGGAAAGGLIGSQFGKGGGNVAATVGGVIAGGIIGNAIGRDADEDRYYGPAPARTYYAPSRTVYVDRPVYVRPAPVVYYDEYRPWHRYRYYRGW